MDTTKLGTRIIETATRYAGLYEIRNNALWGNPAATRDALTDEFLLFLKSSGWYPPLPYCAGFAKASWLSAYRDEGAPESFLTFLKNTLTLSSMQNLENLKDRVVKTPLPGAMGIYQNGDTFHGHVVVVIRSIGNMMATVEGNTSAGPGVTPQHDSEGDGVYKRTRAIDFTKKAGLRLRGFINPIPWPDTPSFPLRQAVVTSKGLNVRSGPGVGNEVLGVLLRDTPVSLLPGIFAQATGDWWEILYNGKSGWVSSRYLRLL